MLSAPQEVIPLTFGLKYKPPKLGLQYKLGQNGKQSFLHEIPLAHVTASSDAELIAQDIQKSNKIYLS